LSNPDTPAPGGQPVPELDALAALLADLVELAGNGAWYPNHVALIAEQARGFDAVQRALGEEVLTAERVITELERLRDELPDPADGAPAGGGGDGR
jgi:hypothetical protein